MCVRNHIHIHSLIYIYIDMCVCVYKVCEYKTTYFKEVVDAVVGTGKYEICNAGRQAGNLDRS